MRDCCHKGINKCSDQHWVRCGQRCARVFPPGRGTWVLSPHCSSAGPCSCPAAARRSGTYSQELVGEGTPCGGPLHIAYFERLDASLEFEQTLSEGCSGSLQFTSTPPGTLPFSLLKQLFEAFHFSLLKSSVRPSIFQTPPRPGAEATGRGGIVLRCNSFHTCTLLDGACAGLIAHAVPPKEAPGATAGGAGRRRVWRRGHKHTGMCAGPHSGSREDGGRRDPAPDDCTG